MAMVEEIPVVFGSQQFIDRLALLYHREIAKRLARDPERILGVARRNLARWLQAHEPGSGDARCFEEWHQLLEQQSVAEIMALLTAESEEGQRLRSSTPFTGILTLQERKELREYCAKRAVV